VRAAPARWRAWPGTSSPQPTGAYLLHPERPTASLVQERNPARTPQARSGAAGRVARRELAQPGVAVNAVLALRVRVTWPPAGPGRLVRLGHASVGVLQVLARRRRMALLQKQEVTKLA